MRNRTATALLFLISVGIAQSAFPADRKIDAISPLQAMKPIHLDRAKGIGPRFRFALSPVELPSKCAASIWVHVNDAEFVDYPGLRTSEEFRSKAAKQIPLSASDAARLPVHTNYALSGEGSISGAFCFNAKAGTDARGFCTAIISGSDYSIIYNFDPAACQYNNVAVAKALEARLIVEVPAERQQEPDCVATLEGFVKDIDDVLSKNPRNILDVTDVLDRHFPLRRCTTEQVSSVLRQSRYFRSVSMNGPKMSVYSIASREVVVSFGLTDTGDSEFPSAGWVSPSL
jgi:hypothetical protein